jgi:hypothetical protein
MWFSIFAEFAQIALAIVLCSSVLAVVGQRVWRA